MGATAGASAAFQGVSSIGNGYIQASALRSQADYEKKIAELNNQRLEANAGLVDEAATDAVKRGNTSALQRVEKQRQDDGTIRAQAASEGALGSEAQTNAMSAVDTMSAVNQASIKTNAYREAFGLQSQSIALRGQEQDNTFGARIRANQLEGMAKSSMITGWTKAIGFGMTSASDYSKSSKTGGEKAPSGSTRYSGPDSGGFGGMA